MANWLYHGTSVKRWESIQRDGVLRIAPYGDQHVSLTTSVSVARHFAELAAECDDCAAIVLMVDERDVQAEPFSSDVWGEGECDWEKERACFDDIPLAKIYCRGTPHKP